MAKNATKWPLMIEAIYNSFGTGDHSGDATTRRVTNKIVSWLVKGKKLSPNLRKALLLNIEQRTSFVVMDAPEEIRLTENQLKHIRRTKPEWVAIANGDDGLDMDETSLNGTGISTPIHPSAEDLSTTIQRLFNSLSTTIQRSFNDLSTIDPVAALALAYNLVEEAQKSVAFGKKSDRDVAHSIPKEEIMGEDESNHDGSMTAASQAIAHEVPEASHQVHVTPSIPSEEGEVLGHRSTGAGRAVVSFFHNDPAKRPSANLEIGSDRYSLVFSDADFAEGQLHDVCSKEWLATLEQAGIGHIRSESRAAGSEKVRHRVSPLYAAHDTHARKGPAVADAVAVLFWNEDQQPESVTIISGGDTIMIPLVKFYGKSTKAPSHKGDVKIAA